MAKRYRHIGTHPLVLDGGRDAHGFQIDRHVAVGEPFEADLSPSDEARLVRIGAIAPVDETPVSAAPAAQES